jgi:hypothetical protein
MRESPLVTDADLARAREDSDFRQRLLTDSLERLLGELNKLQRSADGATRAGQLHEGAELAVKLADLLRRLSPEAPRAA